MSSFGVRFVQTRSNNIQMSGSSVLHRNSTVACRVTNVTSEHYGDP